MENITGLNVTDDIYTDAIIHDKAYSVRVISVMRMSDKVLIQIISCSDPVSK